MIVSSVFVEGPAQADGRRYVNETHTDDHGHTHTFEWLGDQDAAAVLSARAALLSEQIAQQRAVDALVFGTKLPLAKYDFRQLFTASERAAVDAFEAGLESNESIDAATKAVIRTGFKDFASAGSIARPFLPDVITMLELFVYIGLITTERKAQIVSAGNG